MLMEQCILQRDQVLSTSKIMAEAEAIVMQSAGLEALLGKWLSSQQREILLSNIGEGNERSRRLPVRITLTEDGQDVLSLLYSYDALEDKFPLLRPISDFVRVLPDDASYGGVSLEVDDAELNSAMGFDPEVFYLETLVGPLLSPTQALRMAFMYALAEIGEVRIRLLDSDELFVEEEDELESVEQPIAVMYLTYSEAKPRHRTVHSFNEAVYIRLGSSREVQVLDHN